MRMSFDEAMRMKDQMPKGLFRGVEKRAADEIWLCAIEATERYYGIQTCRYPNCVGGQNGTVCHKHCPRPCTDCRGLGYEASGQICACQGNPSF